MREPKSAKEQKCNRVKEQRRSLEPFLSSGLMTDMSVTSAIARQSNRLSILYEITGNISEIIIQEQADKPTRRKDLWKDTCFEVFLGVKDASDYWEFNLSPSGHWNVFRFDAYRRGGQEERAYTSLPFTVQRSTDSFAIEAEFSLTPIIQAEQPLDAGISAVIRKSDGEMTYWALTHLGPKVDFHLRKNFMIKLF